MSCLSFSDTAKFDDLYDPIFLKENIIVNVSCGLRLSSVYDFLSKSKLIPKHSSK